MSSFLTLTLFAGENAEKVDPNYIDTLIIPLMIAAFGYIFKILYELITERSRRSRNLLEKKLKNFYWPILTRLEQNEAIWVLILNKINELDDLEKKIGLYVEEKILLKNHRDIMSIIINNRHFVKFDKELSDLLKEYFMHIAIYEGILESKENTFPGVMGAPYPKKMDQLIKERTERLQQKLDRKIN